MKKQLLFLILFILVGSFYMLFAGDIIKNPGKPNNPAAGRIIKLKKVMEIPGAGDNYVIIYPYDLDFSADGNMYLSDEGQLLVFTPDGVFLKNLYHKGQGPGELEGKKVWIEISGGKVYIFDPRPAKIIITDLKGKLIQEKRLRKRGEWGKSYKFIGVPKGKPLFWETDSREVAQEFKKKRSNPLKNDNTVVERRNYLLFYSLSTGEKKKMGEFSTKVIVSGLGMGPVAQLLYRLHKDKLILSHTSEYLVNIVDLKSGNVKKFTRKYKRIENAISTPLLLGRKYFPDISYFYVFKDYIWVKTFTHRVAGRCWSF